MVLQTDDDIVQKIIAGDEKTLFIFYKTHNISLCNFIYKKIGNHNVAEELAQDTFIDFIEGLRNFRGTSSVKTYLYSIARFKTIDYINKKKIRNIFFSSLPLSLVENVMAVFIDDEIEKTEMAEKIKNVIYKLPNDYQLVLRLKYVDGKKVQEIALALTLSFKATESLLFRARKAFIKTFHST